MEKWSLRFSTMVKAWHTFFACHSKARSQTWINRSQARPSFPQHFDGAKPATFPLHFFPGKVQNPGQVPCRQTEAPISTTFHGRQGRNISTTFLPLNAKLLNGGGHYAIKSFFLSGPVLTIVTGTPSSRSSMCRYWRAVCGRSLMLVLLSSDCCQPGKDS